MAACITFVAGRAGFGKSRMIRQAVQKSLAAGKKAALIVPEQFTFESERALSAELGAGLLDVSVYSFTTLARRVLRETGERAVFLSRQGRRMVIRRITEESAMELHAFSGVYEKIGFSEKCAELFALLKRFSISPDQLLSAAEGLQEGSLLRDKLLDISLLYGRTEAYLAKRYMDDEDMVNALIARLPKSSICGMDVYIDGFDLMTEQLYAVMGALMDVAGSLTVSVLCDFSPRCRDAQVFAAERRVYARLYDMAKEKGIETRLINLPAADLPAGGARLCAPALLHLERELYAYPGAVYEGVADAIEIFAAHNRAAEVAVMTAAVLRAAHAGMRYRDMAVIAPDMESYYADVMRAFSREGIPVFADAKHALTAYPAAELIVAALRAVNSDFSQADVLRIMKTRLTGLSTDEEETFENYVLRYGIRGSLFKKPFARGDVPRLAEAARVKLMEPLTRLKEGLKRGSSATKTEALYAYLSALGVAGQIDEITKQLQEQGRLELMEENAQVWNTIMEVLDQLHAILGDEPVSTAKYLLSLEEGLSSYEVGAIPATADQVLFGTVSRTRARDVKALFVLGCNEGVLPGNHPDDGVIDDAELLTLKSMGLTPWGGSAELYETDTLDLYSALAKPSERLWLGYSLSISGDAALPSPVIERIKALFPAVREGTDIGTNIPPISADAGFLTLIRELRRFADTGAAPEGLENLYAYFSGRADMRAMLDMVLEALYHDNSPEPFGRDLSSMLYGEKLSGSATRLETFNECPFMHFVRYGLKAEERREFKERAMDKGTFYHGALERYVNAVLAHNLDWKTITREACDAILEEFLPELIAAHNDGVLVDTARARADTRRMIAAVKDTAYALTRQIAMGEFRPMRTELTFGAGGDYPALELRLADGSVFSVSGQIDRLDEFRYRDDSYIRIIDYKTGGTTFDFSELEAGIRLQLPLYISAVRAAESAAKTAGMYYMPISEANTMEAVSGETLEDTLLKAFKLRGLSLNDVRILRAADAESADWSKVLPVRFSANGVSDSKFLLNETDLAKTERLAFEKAGDTLSSIVAGRAEVLPYRHGKRKACDWCEYRSVCCFDVRFPNCFYRNIRPDTAPAGNGEVDG